MAVGGVVRGMTAGDLVEGIAAGRVRVGQEGLVLRGMRAAGHGHRENAAGHGRMGRRGEIVRRGTAGISVEARGDRVLRGRSIIEGRGHRSGRDLRRSRAGKRVSWRIRGQLRRWPARSGRLAVPIRFLMWRGCFCRIGHGIW